VISVFLIPIIKALYIEIKIRIYRYKLLAVTLYPKCLRMQRFNTHTLSKNVTTRNFEYFPILFVEIKVYISKLFYLYM